MSKRRAIPKMTPPTPPPIEELLDPAPRAPLRSEPRETERQNDRKTESRQDRETVRQGVDKSKCTYYIPTRLAERIDIAHATARVHTRQASYKASKSEFIEAALTYALDEFDRYGSDSQVVRRLTQILERKAE